MKITRAIELQKKFRAGLIICGETDNELMWIGNDKDWELEKDKMIEGEVNDIIYNK